MIVITTHANTDFDGLAAMVAARKLYPEAKLVLPGRMTRNVEEFVALHRDILELKSGREIDLDAVNTLIIVDTRNPRRIGRLAKLLKKPNLELHLYDHHPPAEGDLSSPTEVVELVGAVTTLLVEEIKRRALPLTPFEATVLALGIYEDTGCLVFTSTTERDAGAVAHLLAHGANLAVVSDFLGRPLTDEQKTLLRNLLMSTEHHVVNGIRILIATSRTAEFVGGLALLTHRLAEIERVDAVFCVVHMEDRTHIVSRSTLSEVDTREIMVRFGGGGHHSAASATVKGVAEDEIAAQLLAVIRETVQPPLLVAQIMSSPVKSVRPETRIDEANQIMLRYGHSGLPVADGTGLVGVISRRDVEKATRHNLGHAPVKANMSRNVLSVPSHTPVSEVQTIMIENNVGRLPVVDNGELLGIVSRTDILRTLHPDFQPRYCTLYVQPKTSRVAYMENAAAALSHILPEQVMMALVTAGQVASRTGCTVYSAGEMLRDAALGIPNTKVDLVVEGDGTDYAPRLAAALDGRCWDPGIENQTVVITPDLRMTVTNARQKFMEYGLVAPDTINSPLRHALYRRDFTINALAMALNPDRFGEILDYYGAREDLRFGLIRALHNLSFEENPLRIIRAIRLEKAHTFMIEKETLRLIRAAIRDRLITRVPRKRMWLELKPVLQSESAPSMLARLAQLDIWPLLFPTVTYWEVQPLLTGVPEALEDIRQWDIPEPSESWLCYLMAILHFTNLVTAEEFCNDCGLERRQRNKVINGIVKWRGAVARLSSEKDIDLHEIARYVLGMPREAYPLVLLMLERAEWKQRFYAVLGILREHKPLISGKDIINLGYQPGPYFRRALNAVWKARLKGLPAVRDAEIEVAREFLREWEGG